MLAHARSCQSCALDLAKVRTAIGLYRLPVAAGSADLVPRVSALLPFSPAPRRSVTMRDWAIPGILIFASMVLIPMMAEFTDLKAAFGPGFTFPMALALGSIVTLYSGMFVMSHLDDFSKRIKGGRTGFRLSALIRSNPGD
jgi:hypothetical protein